MKLLRLKLYDCYRSLKFDEQRFPKLDLVKDDIDPICLVGLNGSGKSNLLELIADIFYLLESDLLNYKAVKKPYLPYSDNKKKKEIYFEIDYKIKIKKKDEFVRIIRTKDERNPKFYLFNDTKYSELYKEIDYGLQCRLYLPLVVAYTSGLNDLLSMPFVELQDYYALEVTHQVKAKNYNAKIDSPNMLLMDYDSNAAIVLANYILNKQSKLDIFQDFARIKGLSSFKIVIQLNKAYGNKKVLLPKEFKQIIDDLRKCSTTYQYIPNSEKGDFYEMDFLLNSTTLRLFQYYFKTSRILFVALSKLNLLNTLCIQTRYRNQLRAKRKEGKLLKFPTVATLDKIFRIEQIELILSNPKVRTEYMKISDGEHQFLHIVGAMLLFDEVNPDREVIYLLDEPDTHFNPQWRSDFFKELDKVVNNRSFELILTTHSPFILGDCHGYNVFVFEREEEKNIVSFKRSNYETYGANFTFLLKNMFGFEHQMSNKSREDLVELEKDIQSMEQSNYEEKKDEIKGFEKELKLYGESVEKLFVTNRLGKIKDKILKD